MRPEPITTRLSLKYQGSRIQTDNSVAVWLNHDINPPSLPLTRPLTNHRVSTELCFTFPLLWALRCTAGSERLQWLLSMTWSLTGELPWSKAANHPWGNEEKTTKAWRAATFKEVCAPAQRNGHFTDHSVTGWQLGNGIKLTTGKEELLWKEKKWNLSGKLYVLKIKCYSHFAKSCKIITNGIMGRKQIRLSQSQKTKVVFIWLFMSTLVVLAALTNISIF